MYKILRIEKPLPEWSADIIEDPDAILLDTETTGLAPHGRLVELSITNMRGETLYDSLLKPQCPISEGAMTTHHITEEMVSTAPTILEEWHKIYPILRGKKIITYNAEFDAGRIEHSAMMCNITFLDEPLTFYCLMEEYRRYGRFQRWQKLPVACSQQNIKFDQQHRALGDVLATLEIIRALAKKAEVKA